MARLLSQTLIRDCSSSFHRTAPPSSPCSRFIYHRNRSDRSEKAQLIEVDLEADADLEVFGLRRLEDAIHGIVARRLAPDWLPFVPGSSYWVPPRNRPLGVVEIVRKFKNRLTREEYLSLTTERGWPSSSYFVEGGSPHHPMKTKSKKKKATETEDEEGF